MSELVLVSEAALPTLQQRLAMDIHRRAYHDAGIEVWPPLTSSRAQSYSIARRHCRLGQHDYGHLDWNLIANGADRDTSFFIDRRELQQGVFSRLDTSAWRSRRHLGCFHRRGKARYDLVFSIACRVAGYIDGDLHMLDESVANPAFDAWLNRVGDTRVPGKPSRHVVVTAKGQPLLLLRTDGLCVTSTGQAIELDRYWWSGEDEEDVAARITGSMIGCVVDGRNTDFGQS